MKSSLRDRPSGVAFSAYATAVQALAKDVTTKVNFGGEDFDARGAFDTATSTFFAPESGVYAFQSYVALAAPAIADTSRMISDLLIDGAVVRTLSQHRISGVVDDVGSWGTAVMFLRRGGIVVLRATVSNAANISGGGQANHVSRFSGYLVA